MYTFVKLKHITKSHVVIIHISYAATLNIRQLIKNQMKILKITLSYLPLLSSVVLANYSLFKAFN